MNIADEVRALDLPANSFAIFGSGPMAARGMREAHDADIVVTEKLFKELAQQPDWTQSELRDHHKCLQKGNVSIYDSWAPGSWDIAELIRDADTIEGLPYVRLDSVIEWKELCGRPKDETDLKLIKAYLAQHKN